jgi:hypothetical protein
VLFNKKIHNITPDEWFSKNFENKIETFSLRSNLPQLRRIKKYIKEKDNARV